MPRYVRNTIKYQQNSTTNKSDMSWRSEHRKPIKANMHKEKQQWHVVTIGAQEAKSNKWWKGGWGMMWGNWGKRRKIMFFYFFRGDLVELYTVCMAFAPLQKSDEQIWMIHLFFDFFSIGSWRFLTERLSGQIIRKTMQNYSHNFPEAFPKAGKSIINHIAENRRRRATQGN